MAKRYTDTEKWKKRWFRQLSPHLKCFWHYVCDNCNHAGVWEVDFDLASFFIGTNIHEEEVREVFGKQYIELNSGKRWFIKDFLSFQYGSINKNNTMYKPVESALTKEGLNISEVWGIDGGLMGECPTIEIIWNEIRIGRMSKGICEVCSKKNPDAHHDDYSKPLEIRWLCRKHHMEYHKEDA